MPAYRLTALRATIPFIEGGVGREQGLEQHLGQLLGRHPPRPAAAPLPTPTLAAGATLGRPGRTSSLLAVAPPSSSLVGVSRPPAPDPGVRTAKKISKARSQARQCDDDLTSVAARAYFRSPRGPRVGCGRTARRRVEVLGQRHRQAEPAAARPRSQERKVQHAPTPILDPGHEPRSPPWRAVPWRPAYRGFALVLEQDVEGVAAAGGVDRLDPEDHQRPWPQSSVSDTGRRLAPTRGCASERTNAGHLVGQAPR